VKATCVDVSSDQHAHGIEDENVLGGWPASMLFISARRRSSSVCAGLSSGFGRPELEPERECAGEGR
jgi:hypothetical protein